MITSTYIKDILTLLLDGDNEGLAAKPQLEFIVDAEYQYTGGGLFVSFSYKDGIEAYSIDKKDLILNGVKIETSQYPIEADASLFFNDGLISYLEIWCYLGDYPDKDLKQYTLTQIWKDSPGKQIKKNGLP
ncbi:hypothetical protein HB364_18225 [Pseudoflavitalea sp. X16]|uniref:hypothetical protein n=1 Tax=Paraflavitalea devenefica TaxID=2716334 RepID=UPI00141F9D84|nr:hypothetical protein [Paraflavitalea devenefica]NII27033.1 hypothetical protein [Paraflavitalea devenefica]